MSDPRWLTEHEKALADMALSLLEALRAYRDDSERAFGITEQTRADFRLFRALRANGGTLARLLAELPDGEP